MIKNLKKHLSSELAKGSLVLFVMINIFNFLNYVFHFSMARLLIPADYIVLGVLMHLVYLYSTPSEAIIGVISKYTTKFSMEKEYGKIKFLVQNSLKKTAKYSLILFITATILAGIINYFFWHIDFILIVLTNLLIFEIFLIAILRGVQQGRKKFYSLGGNMILESTIKLVLAITLVLIGFKVLGAILGLVVGVMVAIVFSFYALKDLFKEKGKKAKLDGIGHYSTSFLGAMIAIVLMYSLDVFLAKIYFVDDLAGKYAVISMLGKMIFFGTIPIGKALFPISSEKFNRNEKTKNLFYKSFLAIALLSSVALLIFLFFPKLLILILFGAKYTEVSQYLIYVGIALTFLSFTNLVVMYGLSIERFKAYYLYLFIFVILEFTLFSMFHATLMEFVLTFMISNILMFLGSLVIVKIKN